MATENQLTWLTRMLLRLIKASALRARGSNCTDGDDGATGQPDEHQNLRSGVTYRRAAEAGLLPMRGAIHRFMIIRQRSLHHNPTTLIAVENGC